MRSQVALLFFKCGEPRFFHNKNQQDYSKLVK